MREREREGGREGEETFTRTHLFNVGIDEWPSTDHLMSVNEISHLSNYRFVLRVCTHDTSYMSMEMLHSPAV